MIERKVVHTKHEDFHLVKLLPSSKHLLSIDMSTMVKLTYANLSLVSFACPTNWFTMMKDTLLADFHRKHILVHTNCTSDIKLNMILHLGVPVVPEICYLANFYHDEVAT